MNAAYTVGCAIIWLLLMRLLLLQREYFNDIRTHELLWRQRGSAGHQQRCTQALRFLFCREGEPVFTGYLKLDLNINSQLETQFEYKVTTLNSSRISTRNWKLDLNINLQLETQLETQSETRSEIRTWTWKNAPDAVRCVNFGYFVLFLECAEYAQRPFLIAMVTMLFSSTLTENA